MHLVDHLFVFLLFVVQPVAGALSYRRYLRKIAAGQPADCVRLYRETLRLEWLALAVLIVAWYLLDRPFADLGFVAPGGAGFYAGMVLLALLCGYLVWSWRRAKQMPADEKTRQAESFGDLVHFLPRNEEHYRHFFRLSITAGIVEEIVYRGFVIWYLAQFMPVWLGVLVASTVFGLCHSYQGFAGMARTGVVGLGFGMFFILTGSIWLPIIAHALLDILQGKMIVEIFRDPGQEDPASLQRAESIGS
jgi:membrane protease YdiL (CAAX protease family)